MTRVSLARIELPEFGVPTVEPTIPVETYHWRMEVALRLARAADFDSLVIYGDREHFANLAYLTGYDPRFEESLLILTDKQQPTLVVGLEGWGYSQVNQVNVKYILYKSFSLLGMPRDEKPLLTQIFREAGIGQGNRVGVVGWKYFDGRETAMPDAWLDAPSFIVDTLRGVVGDPSLVANATHLFMNPANGLRTVNDIDQLAVFEFAATHSSQALRNVMFGLEPGMTEYDAVRLMQLNGMPLSVHLMLSAGPRASLGLPSPSSRVIARGEPLFMAYGLRGGLNARAGFVVHDENELPENIRDYVDKLVAPYFAAIVDWYEHIGIGVPGGELYDIIHHQLGDPFFGIQLNPGHLLHLDEWVHSPVSKGASISFKSGMAIQVDCIPATGTPYFTTNIEDGIALADTVLRDEFEHKYPEAWGRILARREFMEESLGIHLKPEVLPFSNIPAYLPPFLLNPGLVMRVTQ